MQNGRALRPAGFGIFVCLVCLTSLGCNMLRLPICPESTEGLFTVLPLDPEDFTAFASLGNLLIFA